MLGTVAPAAQAQTAQRIEVTGTAEPGSVAGTRPGLTVIDAAALARAGIGTAEQALRRIVANQSQQSLSQSVGEYTGAISEADLRGLGADKTLVLLNGRRLANHAYDAGAVDLNAIPLAAVERIEVQREGASALYGSGAIAGAIDFILRRDHTGIEALVEAEAPQGAGGKAGRVSLTAGLGRLDQQGYNALLTVALRQQQALAGAQRPFSSSAIVLGEDGRLDFSKTLPSSFPGDLDGYEPSLGAGCAPPRSVPDAERSACRYDFMADVDLLPRHRQASMLGRVTAQLAPGHTGALELLQADNRTTSHQTPVAATMVLPDTSPYWPAGRPSTDFGALGRGGVVDWLIAPAGQRSRDTRSRAQRLQLSLEGSPAAAGDTGYQIVLGQSRSRVSDSLQQGHLDGSLVQQALLDGRLNPFGAQSAAGLAALQASRLQGRIVDARGEVSSIEASAWRALWPLDGGALAVKLGLEARRETFEYRLGAVAARLADPALEFAADVGGQRRVNGISAELSAPIANTVALALAARHERYGDSGAVNSAKLSLRWQPAAQWLLRASASADYRAATLYELRAPRRLEAGSSEHDDPLLCPDGVALPGVQPERVCERNFLQRSGGPVAAGAPASSLRPETSHHQALGLVFAPMPGTTLGLDLWRLRLRDQIDTLPVGAVFADPARYPDRIVRCSQLDAAERERLGECLNAAGKNLIAFVDTPIQNLGSARWQGLDLSFAVARKATPLGAFGLSLEASRLLRADTQVDRGAPYRPGVGRFIDDMPVFKWQHLLELNWQHGPWSAAVSQAGKSSYLDQDGRRKVAAYRLVDLSASYGGLPGLTLSAAIKNLFDRQPPYTAQDATLQVNYDPRTSDPIGRALVVRLVYSWP